MINWYDELTVLNENIDTIAEKAFYDAATNSQIDVDNFSKAFKTEIPTTLWNQIFDPQTGKLKHKGTYGDIKNSNLPFNIVKALKKFWAMQFVDFLPTVDEVNTKAKKVSDAKTLWVADKEMAKKVFPLINFDLYKKAVEEYAHLNDYGIEPFRNPFTSKYKLSDVDHSKPLLKEPIIDEGEWREGPANSSIGIHNTGAAVGIRMFKDQYARIDSKKSVQDNVNHVNEIIQDYYDELTKDSKYENCRWYSLDLRGLVEARHSRRGHYKYLFLFQQPEGGIDILEDPSWEDVIECDFEPDVILSGVRVTYDVHTRVSWSDAHIRYFSVHEDADAMTYKELGIPKTASAYNKQSLYRTYEYREVGYSEASDNRYYLLPEMDYWYEEIEYDNKDAKISLDKVRAIARAGK